MHTLIAHERCVLIHGDSVRLSEVLAPDSIDALITDPPAGIAFMGKSWDKDKGGRDGWVRWLADTLAPSYRALKPGGYGLVWALPRTSHWTAYALEACGFEICDRVSHLFGTGFPKSMDLSKAIDKHLGAERVVVGPNPNSRPNMVRVDAAVLSPRVDAPLSAPGCPESAQWEGWGTALKPACEDWWLVQKPFVGTYAANVLAHGVGGLNIDACRIDGVHDVGHGLVREGRWPAHLVLSHSPDCADACAEGCAVRVLDEQSVAGGMHSAGAARDGSSAVVADQYDATSYQLPPNRNMRRLGDQGGASRFYYCAKGSRREKDAGLDHLPARTGAEATDRVDGQAGLQNPRAGAGRTGGARNIHPTVKSVELMRWLIRLITRPGGTVLDPFAGSGTTGIAALEEGMSFVGCEQGGENGEYLPIIEGRLRHALGIVTR